jgi:glucose-6-phosphate dehydrogenase assembly protein OpcA
MDDVWSATDTTPGAIEAALRGLLAQRHRVSEAFAPARVLNLVVVVDGEHRGEVENRLRGVGRYHPSRVILCAVTAGRRELDAVVSVTSDVDEPAPGDLALLREKIELEIGERHLASLDTIVDPLLVSDIVTLAWAPHGHTEGLGRLRRLAVTLLLDSQDEPDVGEALDRAVAFAGDAYVVDLAWLRSTPWRERVAAAFDPPALRKSLAQITRVQVRHRHDSQATGLLFCGWLASRLGWRAGPLEPEGGGVLAGDADAGDHAVRLVCEPVDLATPGLCGVSIETSAGETVTLSRAQGGLLATREAPGGGAQEWRMLGASRGEGGILGEGVRQALLRDPTYRPALAAARAMAAGD